MVIVTYIADEKILNKSISFINRYAQNYDLYLKSTKEYNRTLRNLDKEFFSKKTILPYPLYLDYDFEKYIRKSAMSIYTIIEKVLTLYKHGMPELRSHFDGYEKFIPYINKRSRDWQGYGRYDFMIDKSGEVKFIELNTATASACVPYYHINSIYYQSLPPQLIPERRKIELPYERFSMFGENILKMEYATNADSGAVAILLDNNQKTHEAELISKSLGRAGKRSIISNAENLECRGKRYYIGNEPISSVFNKFRIFGEAHHWNDDAFNKYHVLMQAAKNNDLLMINNFSAMVISEDKSILATLRKPAVQRALDVHELVAIEKHIPLSLLLEDADFMRLGVKNNIIDYVTQEKDEFIIKPSSDYRGSNVFFGEDYSKDQWHSMLKKYSGCYVAQQKIHSTSIPVPVPNALQEEIDIINCSLSGGIYFFNKNFVGLAARVADISSRAINAAKGAYTLPVYICTGEDDLSWR